MTCGSKSGYPTHRFSDYRRMYESLEVLSCLLVFKNDRPQCRPIQAAVSLQYSAAKPR